MTEKIYKIKSGRLLAEWIGPIIIMAFLLILAYLDFDKKAKDYIFKIIASIVILGVFVGPFWFLFHNHLSKSEKTQLKITDDYIELMQDGASNLIKLTDIKSIVICSMNTKYYTAKLTWADIFKWKIRSDNAEMIFSSLLIRTSTLEKIFKEEFVYEFEYIPTM